LQKSIRLRAFAKINLGLRVLAERPDGFHEIRTIFQTIALHDRLEISLRRAGEGIRLECDSPEIPSGPENLVYRACDLWRRARGFRGGVRVRLAKVIPAGSGLGGASSDAAATLEGLERLTGEKLPWLKRFSLAAQLGSDVPLFLLGGRVLGCGRGEEVYPLPDLPPRKCLVVFPGFPVSTAEAYREVSSRLGSVLIRAVTPASSRHWGRQDGGATSKLGRHSRLTSQGKPRTINNVGAWPQFPLLHWGPAENDFEPVVFAKWPELARLKAHLIRAGAEMASLTGSGSAVYAVFESTRQLLHASKLIPKGWLKFRSRTLSRADYRRLRCAEK
jgi:4-diphosphocytidyl-2-C-methyl-D-erythritol kinase